MVGMPCPECCGGDCWEWSDDFTRANSSDVGSDWSEHTGNWEILDNELHELVGGGGTANAKIFCTQQIPRRSAGDVYVSVDVVDPQEDDVFFIYPSATSTSNSGGVSVSFTFDGSSSWTIAVSAGGSGTGSAIQTKTLTGGKAGLWVCCDYTSGNVIAGVEGGITADPDVGYAWQYDCVFTPGRYTAIGHNNSGGGTFDDFAIYELRVSATKLCVMCLCDCDGVVPGKVLTASVTSGVDRAACLEGEDFEMYWEWASGSSFWEGTLHTEANDPHTDITFKLTCDDSDDEATVFEGSDSQANEAGLGGYDAWDNPTYAEVDDDFNYAEASVKVGEPSQFLYLSTFGFSIPLNVTITGVEVIIQHIANVAGDVKDYAIHLHNGGTSVSGANKAKTATWSDSEQSVTYGAQNDTWGWSLDRDLVNGTAFGVIISAVGSGSTARTAGIDYVTMKIHYRHRPGYNYKLSISNGACCAANTGGCSGQLRANTGSACNPLSLNFGPFYLSRTDLTCWACQDPGGGDDASGAYYITVVDT